MDSNCGLGAEPKHSSAREEASLHQGAAAAMPDTSGLNFFAQDHHLSFVLKRYLTAEEVEKAFPHLSRLGQAAGSELDELARRADKHAPQLIQYNAKGERIDTVEYHPSYREMEAIGYREFGLVAMSHRPGVLGWTTRFPHVLKYAFWYVFAQSEFGLCCPMSMTDSAARILEQFASPELQQSYLPKLTSTDLDDLWTAAQFMTEKQGGSDVGANTVVAKKVGQTWEIWGDKWFCSNVSADVALVLARPEGAPAGTKGLGLFLVPRKLQDGSLNRYAIQRLKDKLGTRDMASGEVTFQGALAYVIGELDSGFKQMMAMVNSSRLSNAVRSAGMMRRSYLEALVSARGRQAFGQTLAQLPLMQETLIELLLDSEAAASTVLHTANVYDRADTGSAQDKTLLRILTPILKGYICKRARYVAAEAMEVRGGNGYIEDWVNPKLVRDTHLGSIWEGTTNIMALDVLRALVKDLAGEAFFHDIDVRLSNQKDPLAQKMAQWLQGLTSRIQVQIQRMTANGHPNREWPAKHLMNRMYHLFAASLLLEEADLQITQDGSYGRLVLTLQYVIRHLLSSGCDDLVFAHESLMPWVDALIDGEHVPQSVANGLFARLEQMPATLPPVSSSDVYGRL
ncbi:acyl-CoA dehydrogenase family protein [Alicyclobacillus tolerans]|uniref:acyl-CoA dehydrogenase family protein n=1 Tax=Alicyclobacillus tolerans TaxID=90970 RepID=UPI001F23B45D|nr:acyl-CoA dehydrogenase family protein [Alicyclobacillus tolerans]MCF8564138.1 acyl-CoA dehydrogenase family protein [Alicyclobacillus tolerans]